MNTKRYHGSVIIAAACCAGVFSGCAKAPVQELAAAKAAVKAAQDVEADKYLPNNFLNVQKALSAAEAEMALQSKTFILSRNYNKAKQLIGNAASLAAELKADAPGAKAAMKTQVEEGIAAAQAMAKETRLDIKKAPRSKGKDVLKQMEVDLNTAETGLTKAAKELAAGNIPDAARSLADAQKLLKKIFGQLSTGGEDGLM